ncbi:MAG: hypothetical protein KC635_28250 [Myxococcales bacterium]|nr:hypothetical protein [Myxococcales bacterium]MCB9732804.1 hypothetical protein [Deltaproteobacteria bacterium]
MTRKVTIEELAAEPRWSEDRIRGLAGRVRGNALRSWGLHVARHWGPRAPDLVRSRLGLGADALPDVPTKRHWLPVWAQIKLAHVIVDEWLDGDILAFEKVFGETAGTGDKVIRWVAAKLGPTAVLKRADSYHESVCDVGKCLTTANATSARLDFRGADVFGNPTWRILNMMGMSTMFDFMKRDMGVLVGYDEGPRDFVIEMAWK